MSYDPYSGFSQSYGGTTFDQDQLALNTRFASLFDPSSSVSAENVLQLAESPDALGSVADILASTNKMTFFNEFKTNLEKEKKEYQVSAWNTLPDPYRQVLVHLGYKEPKIDQPLWAKAIGAVVKGVGAVPGLNEMIKVGVKPFGYLLQGWVFVQNVMTTATRASYDVGQDQNRYLLRMEQAGDLLRDQGFNLSKAELDALRDRHNKQYGYASQEGGLTKFNLNRLGVNTVAPEDRFLETDQWEGSDTTPVNEDAYNAFVENERALRKDPNLGASDFLSAFKRTYNGEEYIRPGDQLRQYKKMRDAGFSAQAYDLALHMGQGKDVTEFILQRQKDINGNPVQVGSQEFIEARQLVSGYLQDPVFQSVIAALGSKYARVSPGRQLADTLFQGWFKDTAIYDTVSGAGDLVYQLVFDPTIVGGKALKVSNVIRKGIAATDLPRVTSVVKAMKVAEEAGADFSNAATMDAAQQILREAQIQQPVNAIPDSALEVANAQKDIGMYLDWELAGENNRRHIVAAQTAFENSSGLSAEILQNIYFKGSDQKLYIDKNFFAGLDGQSTDVIDKIIVGLDETKRVLNSEIETLSGRVATIDDANWDSFENIDLQEVFLTSDDLIDQIDILQNQLKMTDFTIFDIRRSTTADRLRVTQAQKTKRWVDRINNAFIEIRDNPDNLNESINRLKDDLPDGLTIVPALFAEHQRLIGLGKEGLDNYDNLLQYINDSYRMFAVGVGTKLYTRGFGRTTVPEKYRIWGGGEKSINYEPPGGLGGKYGMQRGVPGIYLAMPEITRGGSFSRAFLRKADGIFDAMGTLKSQTIAGRVISKPFRVIGNGLWNLTNHGPSSQVISVVGDDFGKNIKELINTSRMAGMSRAEREDLWAKAVTGQLVVEDGIDIAGVKRWRFKQPPTGLAAIIDNIKQTGEELVTIAIDEGIDGFVPYALDELVDMESLPAGTMALFAALDFGESGEQTVYGMIEALQRVASEYGSLGTALYLNTKEFQRVLERFRMLTLFIKPELIGSPRHQALLALKEYLNETIISENLFGNLIASRYALLDSFYNDLFARLGITDELLDEPVYGNGESIIKKLNRYRKRTIYAPGGLDQQKIGDTVVSRPVLPIAQFSDQMAIPDTRLLLKHMQNLTITQRMFRFGFGSEFFDTVMGRYWKPITLIRLGFIPRAAGEEMFAFFARDGFSIMPALAARYASRDTRGVLSGLVNKLGESAAGYGKLLGNMGDGFWDAVNEEALEKEVWEFSFASQFKRHSEYLDTLRARTLEQLGRDLSKADHIQASAAWITASLTRYFRNNIVKMLPREMKEAMVAIASKKTLGIYEGFEALQPVLHDMANVISRNAFYQQTIADDIMTIGSGIPEAKFDHVATREVTARDLRTGDDRTVKVRVGREFVEIDALSDGDLARLSYWYTQVGNDPIAMEALRAGLRGSLTEAQLLDLEEMLIRTGFHIRPEGIPEGVSALWVDPVTGEFLAVNDEVVELLGNPFRHIFYNPDDPASPIALDYPTGALGIWSDRSVPDINALGPQDFIDSLVYYARKQQNQQRTYQNFEIFESALDDALRVNRTGLGRGVVENVTLDENADIFFWFFDHERESVVKFIEQRISRVLNERLDLFGEQAISPLLAKENAERIVDDLVDRALQQVPNAATAAYTGTRNSLRSNLLARLDLYRYGYISKEQLEASLDNILVAYQNELDRYLAEAFGNFQNALPDQTSLDYSEARQVLNLYWNVNPNAPDVNALSDDDILNLTFEDFSNAMFNEHRVAEAKKLVADTKTAISSAIDDGWVKRVDELLALESGQRHDIPNVTYKLEERYSTLGRDIREYQPFFETGELYRTVSSDSQWAIDESGNLILFANNRWGRGRGFTISTHESLDFAEAWAAGGDATQTRIIVLDAEAVRGSVRGPGMHDGEIELGASELTESLVVPAGFFKLLYPSPRAFNGSIGLTGLIGTKLPRTVNPTRNTLLQELRMVAAGAPIESTKFLKTIDLNKRVPFAFANRIDESGREVSELTPELMNVLGIDRSALVDATDEAMTILLSYGDVIRLMRRRGFVGPPAKAETIRNVQKVSEISSVAASAAGVVSKTRTVFKPEEISTIRKHLTNSTTRSRRPKVRNLEKQLRSAGVTVDELPQVLQNIVRFNAADELTPYIDEEIPGYDELLFLFSKSLKELSKSGNRDKLDMLIFYLQPTNKRLRLVLLDGAPIQVRSMDEVEQLIRASAASSMQKPRYSYQVRSQRRSWQNSSGETRETLIPDGEMEVYAPLVNQQFMDAISVAATGSRVQWIPENFGRSSLTPDQRSEFNSIEVVFNAIVAMNPAIDERTLRLFRAYFDGIDNELVMRGLRFRAGALPRLHFPLSTVAFTNKKDAQTIQNLLQSWRPTLTQSEIGEFRQYAILLGSTTGKVGMPYERTGVPFIAHRADDALVTTTDNTYMRNFSDGIESAAGEAAPVVDPDEDFADTITKVLMKSFVDKEGSLMHELAVPLINDEFGVQTMSSVAPGNLPSGLYAPKEFIPDENAIDRFTTKWFEKINSAVSALAREPMYLFYFANAYAGAKANAQILRTPGLDNFVRALLPSDVDSDDLLAFWSMIPPEFHREIVTHDDLVDAIGNLVQRNLLPEESPVIRFLLENQRDANKLIGWMRQELHIQDAIILDASQRAMKDVIPYIDDHKVRSLFQDKYRNVFPFLFAQESFLKRWIRSAMYDPAAIRRAQLVAHSVTNSMWSEEDDYGNKYFVIPGTQSFMEVLGSASHIPFLNKFVQPVPIDNPKIGFNVERILPGIPADFQHLPGLSPIAMVPVNAIVRHYPELGPTFETFTGGYPIDPNGNFVTETLRDFVPPNYIRAFVALTNIISENGELGKKEVASSQIAAEKQLASEAQRLRQESFQLRSDGEIEEANRKLDLANTMEPPPNSSEEVIEQHLDMVKNWSYRNLFVRAIMGWSFGSTGQNIFAKNGLDKEFLDLMQEMPFEEALAIFYAEHPYDAPYVVFKTEKSVKAPLPRTNTAAEWMIANKGWLGSHPNAAPWLIPAGKASDEFSARAQNMYIAADLVNYKDLNQWYGDFKYAVGANEYFPLKLQYDVRIAQTATAAERERLRAEWRVIADRIKMDNPIFGKRLTENVSDSSLAVLNEMKLIFALPEDERPNIKNKEVLSELTDLYFRYKGAYEALRGQNSSYARRQRELLRNDFFAAGSMLVSVSTEARSFWNSIVLPATDLVSEWEIRQALGD